MNAIIENNRIVFATIPQDTELLALIGEVSIRHSQHDYVLKMVLRSLCGETKEEAILGKKYKNIYKVRKLICKAAKDKIKNPAALKQLEDILLRSEIASTRRNTILHGVWGCELDGPIVLYDKNIWQDIPSKAELLCLAQEFCSIAEALNEGRFGVNGFLNLEIDEFK